MRGVADQRDAIRDERARDGEAERIGAARPDHADVPKTEAEAPFELAVEFIIGERDDPLASTRPRSTPARSAARSAAGSRTVRPAGSAPGRGRRERARARRSSRSPTGRRSIRP